MTYKEFLGWSEYFVVEYEDHTKDHYYLAQIAQLISISLGAKNPKINDYLLGFKKKTPTKVKDGHALKKIMKGWFPNFKVIDKKNINNNT